MCAPNYCNSSSSTSSSSGSGSSSSGGGPVVLADQVVGPYETVQLSSQGDPQALQGWLTQHGYAIPPDIAPVITAYVLEGFNFLALKLVPGAWIDKMKPVRVTTPGAGLGLPLRMVAAGTGAFTTVSLWIAGEGRYEPTNFPTAEIPGNGVTWDWATQSSDYSVLKQQAMAANGGATWLVAAGEPSSQQALTSALQNAFPNPYPGYGDGMGMGAQQEAQADLDTLFSGIPPESFWLTRLEANLPRTELATDLVLGASAEQTPVTRTFYATKVLNYPTCPSYPPCTGSSSSSSSSASGAGGAGGGGGAGGAAGLDAGGGCAIDEHGGSSSAAAMLALAIAGALARRGRAGKR
jgi:hypothetical protein